jgi:hypothetical protein
MGINEKSRNRYRRRRLIRVDPVKLAPCNPSPDTQTNFLFPKLALQHVPKLRMLTSVPNLCICQTLATCCARYVHMSAACD